MTKKRRLLLALIAIHFALISAKAFGNLKRGENVWHNLPLLHFVIENITELTVLQADYGFFSPNVSAGSRITIQAVSVSGDTVDAALRLPGNEIGLRFHTSMTVFRSIEQYRELVARSLAAKAYALHPDAALVVVSGYDHVLPSRKDYRASMRLSEELFFRAVFATSRGREAGLAASAVASTSPGGAR